MIDWSDFNAIFKIATILLISSFALFLPLTVFLGKNLATKFVIPASIAFQIIFGYIFYSMNLAREYPLFYLLFILGINIWSFWQLKLKNTSKKISKGKIIATCIVPMILFGIIIYNRFFDSFSTVAPGEIDTYNHLVFLKDLIRDGILSFPQYAPGFHLFIFPLTFFTENSEIYRFTGPVIGIITSLSLFLLLRDIFKSLYSRYLLLVILCLPIFNQLFLQEIGFFSTSLSFIFIPALIAIIANDEKAHKDENGCQLRLLAIFSIITTALSLTLPYLYIQYLPALSILVLIAFIFKKYFNPDYIKHLLIILIISIIGFILCFGHVYLQTKILKRATDFPGMELTYIENGEIVTTNNYQMSEPDPNNNGSTSASGTGKTNLFKTKIDNALAELKQQEFFVSYVAPMSNVAWNALIIKNVREPKDLLSMGAYLWIILSIVLIPISIVRKNKIFYTISVFSLIFGVATQFGILELTTYRGRSGWYLMLFTLIGGAFILDWIIAKKIDRHKFILPIIAVLGIIGFVKPPTYYRPYYTSPYEVVKDIVSKSPTASVNIITRDNHISVVSKNISTENLTEEKIKEPCARNICLIIIENKLLSVDPVLSQQASSLDKNFEFFTKQQSDLKSKNTALIEKIKIMPEFKSYELYWEDNNLQIYKYKAL
jgi:hypothetical protein